MPENEEIFEEKIELKPKERVSLLMLESAQQQQLENFINFEITPENLKEFMAMRKQATFDQILTINELESEKIDFFRIHPDFKGYFKTVIEKPKKEKVKHHFSWYGFLRQDWRDAFANLMRKEAQYQPRVALLVEILLNACKKYENYIFSAVPSMQKMIVPGFGKGRTKIAFELHQQGKNYPDIAREIGVPLKQVYQYVKKGKQSAEKKALTSKKL